MALRDLYLICFGAAAAVHAAQTVLAATWRRRRTGSARVEAVDGIALGLTAFFWQFGNFFVVLLSTLSFDGIPAGSGVLFRIGNFFRDGSLVCFPLLFSFMCLHIPDDVRGTLSLLSIGRYLWYPLWPWTALALSTMAFADAGFRFSVINPGLAAQITLYVMLFYFIVFTVTSMARRGQARASGMAALVRAHKAAMIAGLITVITFILMLTGFWNVHIPFLRHIELAAMLTSVPFAVAVAYRLYQFPFMDAFVREVLSGVILLAALIVAISIGNSIPWIVAFAVLLVYCKAPLTRWVDRRLMGHEETVEQQEERIGTAIRGLTRLDEFGARVAEILANELEAEWVRIDSTPATDAVHRFEIVGSGLWLSAGPRIGGRQYMSRELRIGRAAALELAAHHHHLTHHELRELTARAQIRALQAQINPHFLFNTLNVLANLIHSNPAKAERVTEELAEIFRYALESTRMEWVKLDDELRFLESYLEIEKTRFEERLAYSFNVDGEIRSVKVPPMILQPLVENAIKHGIAPKLEGGEVRISARAESGRVLIVIEDTGLGHRVASRHRGSGIGLTNVRERLHHVFGDAGTLKLEEMHPNGTRAVLVLPEFAGVRS